MMCLVWQFSWLYFTRQSLQHKTAILQEQDETSNNESSFSIQNFFWAVGRDFLFTWFAFLKQSIFTFFKIVISFNKGNRGLTAFHISITCFAINLEIAKFERWDKYLLNNNYTV